jgi:hypothetical protein
MKRLKPIITDLEVNIAPEIAARNVKKKKLVRTTITLFDEQLEYLQTQVNEAAAEYRSTSVSELLRMIIGKEMNSK